MFWRTKSPDTSNFQVPSTIISRYSKFSCNKYSFYVYLLISWNLMKLKFWSSLHFISIRKLRNDKIGLDIFHNSHRSKLSGRKHSVYSHSLLRCEGVFPVCCHHQLPSLLIPTEMCLLHRQLGLCRKYNMGNYKQWDDWLGFLWSHN